MPADTNRKAPGSRYLVRFDDICPTMNWDVWRQVEQILVEAKIRPLLAVVPSNCDPELRVAPPDEQFWLKVRGWQERGWSIGLHGFEHCYVSASGGILGRNQYSEFAGLPEPIQRIKLERGLAIFRREYVQARAWVAPAHSFDDITVRLLRRYGIDCISDGYSLYPYMSRDGMFWVPQQLGRFRKLPFGLWTVCLHINAWSASDIDGFRADVKEFGDQIISLPEIRRSYRTRSQSFSDQLFFNCFRGIRSLKA